MTATVQIKDLKVACLIGCLAWEKKEEQTITVDVALELDSLEHIKEDKIAAVSDYTAVAAQLEFILKAARFEILENAARFLCKSLLLEPLDHEALLVTRVRVALSKHKALPHGALVTVETAYDRQDVSFRREERAWGCVDVVDEIDSKGLYRLNLDPYCELPLHCHEHTREAEMILSPGLKVQRNGTDFCPTEIAQVFHWEKGERHGYRNMGEGVAGILCVDEPKYDVKDEVVANP